MHVGNGLVSLTKSGPTVGTSSLTQCNAEQNAQRKEEDGAQDAQAREVILQDPHSAGRTAAHHHHRGLDYGVGAGVGLLGHCRDRLCRRESLGRWKLVGWRTSGGGDGSIALLWWGAILLDPWDSVIGGRSVLEQRFRVHHLSWP